MFQIFLVASGGAIGALLRFTLSNLIKSILVNSLYSTFCVNILGSFTIGYLISLGYEKNIPENFVKYFLIIGLLGSFTTFSSFSFEVVELLLIKKFLLSFFYIIISVFFCILAAYIGMNFNKFWLKY